jgi:hypothetical protein
MDRFVLEEYFMQILNYFGPSLSRFAKPGPTLGPEFVQGEVGRPSQRMLKCVLNRMDEQDLLLVGSTFLAALLYVSSF